jgi:integrase
MLNTGLRIGEATALRWGDYNEDDKTLRIDSSMIKNKDENGKNILERQESVKTKNSERILKLIMNAINALPTDKKHNYIFCTKDGNPIHPRVARDMLDRMLKKADIPQKSTHVFRHTFASRLFAKGIDVRIVSELLGHSSVATTYNTYISLIKQQKAKAMEAIEDMY